MPQAVFVRLWQRYEHHRRQHGTMAAELLRVLAKLDAASIPAIPYKGPVIAASLYGDPALREFDDLDLLVRTSDALRAQALLREDGYLPEPRLEARLEPALLRAGAQYHRTLIDPRRGIMVEVHWKTDPNFPVERADDSWWSSLGTTTLLGTPIRQFEGDEALLVLCLHATRHHVERLSWVVDIAEWLRRSPDVSWKWMIETAARMGAGRRFAVPITVAHRLLQAPVPGEVCRRLEVQPGVAALADRVIARALAKDAEGLRSIERLAFDLRFYDRVGHRLGHAYSTGLEPSLHEWSQWPLPRPLFALYVPLRIMRLAKKYLRGAGEPAE
jgi:hypothetical protein